MSNACRCYYTYEAADDDYNAADDDYNAAASASAAAAAAAADDDDDDDGDGDGDGDGDDDEDVHQPLTQGIEEKLYYYYSSLSFQLLIPAP